MLLLLVLWTLFVPSCGLAIIGEKNKNFLHETKSKLCKVMPPPPLCTPGTDYCWALCCYRQIGDSAESLWAVSYKKRKSSDLSTLLQL